MEKASDQQKELQLLPPPPRPHSHRTSSSSSSLSSGGFPWFHHHRRSRPPLYPTLINGSGRDEDEHEHHYGGGGGGCDGGGGGPSLDLKLSISLDGDGGCMEALKWQAAEQIRVAAIEKAYAERVRELTRREIELAHTEFARARAMWDKAREEVAKAERLRENATNNNTNTSTTCMGEITCYSCRQRFRPN